MLLFSPPFVNESNPIALEPTNYLRTCYLQQNASGCVLVEPTENTSFIGTLTLFIPPDQAFGIYTVFCRVNGDTYSTEFTVVGKKIIISNYTINYSSGQ